MGFYESIFDRFHHFVAHLFDVGLRVDRQLLTHGDQDENEEVKHDELVDATFAQEKAVIAQKKKACDIDLGRLQDAHSKFVIDAAQHGNGKDKSALTFSDALLKDLAQRADVSDGDAASLARYLSDNEYDTEAIDADFKEGSASLVWLCQLDPEWLEFTKGFL